MKKVKRSTIRSFLSLSAILVLLASFFNAYIPVYASGSGSGSGSSDDGLLPKFIQDIVDQFKGPGGGDSLDATEINSFVNDRVKMGLTILFVGVFIVAIFYSALAAIKFISSQGDASKLEESKGAVKAILMGFAAMILSIVGIFAVIFILGGTSAPPTEINVNVENYSTT